MEFKSTKKQTLVNHIHLGKINFKSAWDTQTRLHQLLVSRKRGKLTVVESEQLEDHEHFFLTCEHDPVFTLGKSGSEDHLLLNQILLSEKGIEFNKINRGGDITYHGPGQLVGYPILDLDDFFTDVHKYVRSLEEAIILTLADYNVTGYREPGYTGVWVEFNQPPFFRKICAIGVHLSRWVTMHGFAFNIYNDLTPFDFIVPCGINSQDHSVCNLSQLVGEPIDMNIVISNIIKNFSIVFEVPVVTKTLNSTIC